MNPNDAANEDRGQLVDAIGDACLVVDLTGTIVAANTPAHDLYGQAEGALVGASATELCAVDDGDALLAELAVCNGRPRRFRLMQRRKTGLDFAADVTAKACKDPGCECVVMVVRETSCSALPLEHDLTLRTLMLNHVSDGIVCHTPDGYLLFANRAALDSWGASDLEAARALGPFGWAATEQRDRIAETMARMDVEHELKFESHGHAPNGQPVHLEIHSTVVETEDGTYIVSATRDISERMATEEMVRYLAYHDTLTGLANRVLLESELEHAISLSDRHEDLVGLIFLDLNDFKPVNDTYGHTVGDAVLREVANRLAGAVRESDTVARPGGDEFVVVIPRLVQRGDLAVVAQKLVECIAEPIVVDGAEIHVNASVGLAMHEPGENAEALLTRADLAMYGSRYSGELGWEAFGTREEAANS